MAIDFMDLASRYAQRRFDQATQPFTDPEAYVNNRMMQNYGVDLNGNTTPVSTTIKYNTDTGAPESVTTKHEVGTSNYSAGADYTLPSPQAQPAMGLQMPTTPAVGMQMPQTMPAAPPAPVAVPDAQAIDEQRRRQLEQAQLQQVQAQTAQQMAPAPAGPAVPTVEREVAQPPAQPVVTAPVTPQAVAQQAVPAVPAIGTPPVPGPGVQVAGAPGAPMPVTQPPAPVLTTPPQWQTELNSAQGDEQKLGAIISNKTYPEEARKKASEGLRSYYKDLDEKTRAEKIVMSAAQGDVKAQNELIRAIRPSTNAKKEEEGSYVKAILFARLGLTQLAQEEQAKITNNTKFEQGMMDGQHYQLERDRRGRLVGALDESGQAVPENTLAKLAAASMKTGTHAFGFTGERAIVPKGQIGEGEEVVPYTNAMNGQAGYVYATGPLRNQEYKGSTPIAKSVGTSAAKKEASEAITLRYTGPIAATRAAATEVGKFNFENKTNLSIPTYGPNRGRLIDNNNGGAPVDVNNGNINAIRNPAPAATVTQAAPAAPVTQAAPTTSGVNPTPGVPGTTAAPTMQPGETPAQFAARQKQNAEETSKIAADQAKLKSGLPDYEATAANTLKTVQDVLTHPGFKISVGGSQPIGSLLAKVPGTEARDWNSKYNQLIGQQFLSAFAGLRGGGAISDKEGAKATAAIAALNDPGITEKEFVRNAKILEDTIKMGVNRRREQAGLGPKYDVSAANATPADLARQELERRQRGQK